MLQLSNSKSFMLWRDLQFISKPPRHLYFWLFANHQVPCQLFLTSSQLSTWVPILCWCDYLQERLFIFMRRVYLIYSLNRGCLHLKRIWRYRWKETWKQRRRLVECSALPWLVIGFLRPRVCTLKLSWLNDPTALTAMSLLLTHF